MEKEVKIRIFKFLKAEYSQDTIDKNTNHKVYYKTHQLKHKVRLKNK